MLHLLTTDEVHARRFVLEVSQAGAPQGDAAPRAGLVGRR